MKKIVFVTLGLLFCTLGAIGAAIPVLPTTPFLLLATACFAKGSTRFHNWFLGTRLYKNHLEDFVNNRSMPLKTKISICSLATVMLLVAFFMMNHPLGRIFILCLIAFKYYYFIFRIETLPSEKLQTTVETSKE